jgi:hypothetical protein
LGWLSGRTGCGPLSINGIQCAPLKRQSEVQGQHWHHQHIGAQRRIASARPPSKRSGRQRNCRVYVAHLRHAATRPRRPPIAAHPAFLWSCVMRHDASSSGKFPAFVAILSKAAVGSVCVPRKACV